MKWIGIVFLFLTQLGAQDTIRLWDGLPPHSIANDLEEYVAESWGVPCAFNVTEPTLTIHRALGENSGKAMIVVPGGGYEVESIIAEGQLIAEYLAGQGITAAVLKYRLPLKGSSDLPQLLPITDVRKAISMMKQKSTTYGFDAGKVGIMGFSAGGHLAATASVHPSEKKDENPDFSGLIYGVTIMSKANEDWLEETLYHRQMSRKEKKYYHLVDHIDKQTPPAFLVHAHDDEVVPIIESQLYAQGLVKQGQAVELHFFAKGDHGFGPGRVSDGTDQWLSLLANWIKRR